MKRARDIRDQLEGLLERVEIELTSNLNDLDAIKKTIISGKWLLKVIPIFFLYSEFCNAILSGVNYSKFWHKTA